MTRTPWHTPMCEEAQGSTHTQTHTHAHGCTKLHGGGSVLCAAAAPQPSSARAPLCLVSVVTTAPHLSQGCSQSSSGEAVQPQGSQDPPCSSMNRTPTASAVHALEDWAEGPGTFQNMMLVEPLRTRCRNWVTGRAGASALGLGLSAMLLEHAAQLGPLPRVAYLPVHALGPQGVTQPCSPHSSPATQPVDPTQPEPGPVLGGGQSNDSEPPHCPLGPSPWQLRLCFPLCFLSLSISDVVSAPRNLSLFSPQSFPWKVPDCLFLSLTPSLPLCLSVCLSLRSLSGTKSLLQWRYLCCSFWLPVACLSGNVCEKSGCGQGAKGLSKGDF